MEEGFNELVNDLVIRSEVSIVAWNRLSLKKKRLESDYTHC